MICVVCQSVWITFAKHMQLLFFIHDLYDEGVFILFHAAPNLAVVEVNFDRFVTRVQRFIGHVAADA